MQIDFFEMPDKRQFDLILNSSLWRVRFGETFIEGSGQLNGYCDSMERMIAINNAIPPRLAAITLLHEVFHAIARNGHGALLQEEPLAVAFGEEMLSALGQFPPWFFKAVRANWNEVKTHFKELK